MDIKKEKPLSNDIDFLANVISYLLVFIPLRGWNLKKTKKEKCIQSQIDFILRGLGVRG
jgi:hypothetical protein